MTNFYRVGSTGAAQPVISAMFFPRKMKKLDAAPHDAFLRVKS
jgi:hypothetical protein